MSGISGNNPTQVRFSGIEVVMLACCCCGESLKDLNIKFDFLSVISPWHCFTRRILGRFPALQKCDGSASIFESHPFISLSSSGVI